MRSLLELKQRKKEYDKKYHKIYYEKNKQESQERARNWKEKNRKRIQSYNLEYKKTHKLQQNLYQKNRLKTDIQFKLSVCLRMRISQAIKAGSAIEDLGCTIIEFKNYIENQFIEGMTWNNWGNGKNKWNIDHIKPLSKFDLSNREQFLEACNYKNLRPLWWIDNLRKGNR